MDVTVLVHELKALTEAGLEQGAGLPEWTNARSHS